jgi:Zn-dependent protease with chaperone function
VSLFVAVFAVLILAAAAWLVALCAPFCLLLWYEANEASRDQAPGAHSLLDALAPSTHGHRPRLFVIAGAQPNGFALASRNDRLVIVTEAVFTALSSSELNGLLAILVTTAMRPRCRWETTAAALALVCPPLANPLFLRRVLPSSRWFEIDRQAADLVAPTILSRALWALELKGRRLEPPGPKVGRSLFAIQSRPPEGEPNRPTTHPPLAARLSLLNEAMPQPLSMPAASLSRGVLPSE